MVGRARPDHVGGFAGERDSDGGGGGVPEQLHRTETARDALPRLGAGVRKRPDALTLTFAIRIARSAALFTS